MQPGDVGRRVSLRHILPQGGQTETLGVLVSVDAVSVTVRTRTGELVRVAQSALVGGRRVPDPAHDIEVAELERVAALGFQPLEQERLGGWTLRAAGGWTGRANSVLALGDPGRPLAEALAHVGDWYAARSLPARFQLPLPLAADLDGELAARGWAGDDGAVVMTTDLATLRARATERADLPPVRFAPEPDVDWLAAYHYRGGALPAVARAVLVNAGVVTFAAVVEAGRVLAIGRGAVAERWLGVTAMEVAPSARRRGLAQHVLRALGRWGARSGGRWAYLQVAPANTAARALYERCGFAEHHRYRYRAAP